MIKIATCQYQLEPFANWQDYTHKIENLVIEAKNQGAQLLLFPEYAGTEIAGWHRTDKALYAALNSLLPRYINFYQELAHRYQVYIQPGSTLVATNHSQYINRAYFFGPSGHLFGYQDKLHLTEFEKHSSLLIPGVGQTLFETSLGKIGIAICYDSEFPQLVSRLVHAGAWLILVPSYTVTYAGFHRVFLCNRARAIENQCYVVTSHVVGSVELSEEIEQTVGKSAILSPADKRFPDNGIIAEGNMNEVSMVTATLEPEKISFVRKHGHTHNFADTALNYSHQEIATLKID